MARKKATPPAEHAFDLSFSAPNPRLVNPELGIASVVARGRGHSYEMDVTLLDAPDQRLLHSGVVLAHRVVDGRGEWYLDAPTWAPWLPVDTVEPMGEAELPQEWIDLVLPLRRWATLGPIAALSCERAEFVLRDRDRRPLGVLRDDKVTASRAGLTFARYREVTLTSLNLSRPQLAWLSETLQAIGASRLPARPTLLQRLGAGPTVITEGDWPTDLDMDAFVARLLGLRHHQIVAADLEVRSGAQTSTAGLVRVLEQLRGELRGLAFVLEPLWLEDIDAEFGWAIESLSGPDGVTRLRGERYLRLLDQLVGAARTPKVGPNGASPAGDVLRAAVEQAVVAFTKGSRKLNVNAADEVWLRSAATGQQVLDACSVAELVLPAWAARVRRRCQKMVDRVTTCVEPGLADLVSHYSDPASEAPAAEAFEAGRAYERSAQRLARVRRDTLADWSPRVTKLQGAVAR